MKFHIKKIYSTLITYYYTRNYSFLHIYYAYESYLYIYLHIYEYNCVNLGKFRKYNFSRRQHLFYYIFKNFHSCKLRERERERCKILLLQKTYFNHAEFTSSKISKRIQNAIVQHHTSSTTDLNGRVRYFN